MIDFSRDDLNTILYAISHLMEYTDNELANLSPDDGQKANFESQMRSCRNVINKLRGKTDIG